MASIQRAATHTLRTAARPTLSRRTPALVRWESQSQSPPTDNSSVPPATTVDDSSMVRQEGASDAQPRHQPDWNVATDYRTSNFSPVPMRVMDGSEPGPHTAAAVLSGAPIELQARTVRIYKPTKTATQSGNWNAHVWRMDWDVLSKGHRWENPLMGWQSSADFMQGTHMDFKSREDAIRFANKQGYEFFVQEPNERRIIPKAYAEQFVFSHKKLKQARTK